MENAKFLRKQHGKTSWDSYEVLLANERVMNERLTDMLLHKKHDLDSLWTEGGKNTYQVRNEPKSMFSMDGGKNRTLEKLKRNHDQTGKL